MAYIYIYIYIYISIYNSVKTHEAVDQERHGITATGFGHTPAERDAFCTESGVNVHHWCVVCECMGVCMCLCVCL